MFPLSKLNLLTMPKRCLRNDKNSMTITRSATQETLKSYSLFSPPEKSKSAPKGGK